MSRYWEDLACPQCENKPNTLNIELVMRHDNYTAKHGSYRYYYFNCNSCDRKVVIHLFTEDLSERQLHV